MNRTCTFVLLALLFVAGPAWGQTFDTIGWASADNSLVTDLASNTYWQHRDTAGTVYTAGVNDSVTALKAWVEDFVDLAIQIWNHNGTVPTTLFFSDTAAVSAASGIKTITLGTKVALVNGNKYSMGVYSVTCGGGGCIPKSDAGGTLGIAIDSTQPGITTSYTPDDASAGSGMLTAFAIVEQWPASGGSSLTVGAATMGAATVGGK